MANLATTDSDAACDPADLRDGGTACDSGRLPRMLPAARFSVAVDTAGATARIHPDWPLSAGLLGPYPEARLPVLWIRERPSALCITDRGADRRGLLPDPAWACPWVPPTVPSQRIWALRRPWGLWEAVGEVAQTPGRIKSRTVTIRTAVKLTADILSSSGEPEGGEGE